MTNDSNRRESPHSRGALGGRYTPPSVAFPAFYHDALILWWSGFNLWWCTWLV